MVRELEAKLADQIEGTSRLVKDCDEWRDKYRKLKVQFGFIASNSGEFVPEYKYTELLAEKTALQEELDSLRKRGFWARVLNRL